MSLSSTLKPPTAKLSGDHRYEALIQLSPDAMFVMQDKRLVICNPACAELLRAAEPDDLLGLLLHELLHPNFLANADLLIERMLTSRQPAPPVEQKYMRRDGTVIDVEVRSAPFLNKGALAIQVIARDITERKVARQALLQSEERHRIVALEATRAKGSLHHEKIILEMIALDEPLHDILREVCLGVEWILPGQALCSILLLDADQVQVRIGAAPSLPNQFVESIRALGVGQKAGCCGTAIALNQQIIVGEITHDAWWEEHHALPLSHGLRACWSTPITTASGVVLGTLGVYYAEPYLPTPDDLAFIGNICHLVGVAIQKDRVERSLQDSEERYRSVVNSLAEGIMVQASDGKILACNPSAERIFRIEKKVAIGSHRSSFYTHVFAEDGTEISRDELPSAVVFRTGKPLLNMTVGLQLLDGGIVWVSENVLPIRQAGETSPSSILISFSDISAVKEAQQRLQFMANHDSLTGLPNRAFLVDRLARALSVAQRKNHRVAVLFLDLDRFKNVNDTIGHEAGDKVLKTVASRLTACTRESDTLARLGGDEFVVLAEGFEDAGYLNNLAERMLKTISEPFLLEGYEYYLGVSIGISVHPEDGDDGQTLLRCADSAMYSAKDSGRNNYQFFTKELNARTQRRYHLEKNLRHSLARNELLLHYQPKVDLGTGRIVGAEALLRWDNPEFGLMLPTDFIPIAEETGLILPIGRWVLEQACRQVAQWRVAMAPDLRIAVNLSPRQFQDPQLVDAVMDILQQTGLPPHVLELEITENLLMGETDNLEPMFEALTKLGVTFSLDDFGTGYSSLSYLQRFPISNLKIDRSFIVGIPDNRDSVALTQTIIAMAHSLDMLVTAEGVEDKAQMKFLRDAGCQEMQGFYFSPPVTAADFENFFQ